MRYSVLGLLLLAATIGTARAEDITSCGQEITEATATLVTDLVCNGSANGAFTNRQGVTINLNGHSITGGTSALFLRHGGRVNGPGELRNAVWYYGLQALDGTLDVRNVDLHDNKSCALFMPSRVGKIRLEQVHLDHNGLCGLAGGALLIGRDVTANANGAIGVNTLAFRLTNLVADDNGMTGLYSSLGLNPGDHGSLRLARSELLRNNLATYHFEIDVWTNRRPRLRGTRCGYDVGKPIGVNEVGTWGVCDPSLIAP